MHTVFSTMSASVRYIQWLKGPDLPTKGMEVTIKGGANVIDAVHINTPRGVATQVTDEELAFLMTDPTFLSDMKNGFLEVVKGKSNAVDKAVKDMQPADKSAPITPDTENIGVDSVSVSSEA